MSDSAPADGELIAALNALMRARVALANAKTAHAGAMARLEAAGVSPGAVRVALSAMDAEVRATVEEQREAAALLRAARHPVQIELAQFYETPAPADDETLSANARDDGFAARLEGRPRRAPRGLANTLADAFKAGWDEAEGLVGEGA